MYFLTDHYSCDKTFQTDKFNYLFHRSDSHFLAISSPKKDSVTEYKHGLVTSYLKIYS